MNEIFIKRAKQRKTVGYWLLAIAIIIIWIGIIQGIISIDSFSKSIKDINDPSDIEKLTYHNSVSLIAFFSMIFFISQILLKLYRYNILKADFFMACADALSLSEKFDEIQKAKYETLLAALIAEKISLNDTDSPSFSIISSKGK